MADRSLEYIHVSPSLWVKRFSEAACEAEIARLLSEITESYGLKCYLLINIPSETSTEFASSVLLTTWPASMLRGYDQAGLIYGSPILNRLRRSTAPFRYEVGRSNGRRRDGKAQIATELFGQHGMQRGAYFPAHSTSGQCGALAFCGDRESLSSREMTELNAIANLAFGKVFDLRAEAASRASLSRREIECLSWASAGKTSVEMSEILGLSEYTVNHYLNRATRKLDAVNRVQAVAKAVRAGLLS
ncbi:LuxR family transcriptional regulator [Sinorhizobium sp. BG8]|uniref:helix-turn-helix transcriptional regulator n=1 Tax=Sinorhizobium sp. BG8 TaxID=2613773 RepID=UPI001AFBC751|nr:LuxR family transcriptional regulator [Sinorhizobium sp. BG8]QRM54493.1 LuxR family transcriptional regulator [Sinorhizobium sp. BG8]